MSFFSLHVAFHPGSTKGSYLMKSGFVAKFALLYILLSAAGQLRADEIRVAVASNFTPALQAIIERFEASTDHQVLLSFGSTGKHYTQIKHGAPFDIFFAADTKRPQLLEKEGMIVPGSRYTYAIGKIVLWSPKTDLVDTEGLVLQQSGKFRYLAIANPDLAPYGRAARDVLQARNLWDKMQGHMVRGENIGQAFQYVKSGNAELGFVAFSQIIKPDNSIQGSYWEVPQSLYTAIHQQAVLLHNSDAVQTFWSFVKSPEAQHIIRQYGYDIN